MSNCGGSFLNSQTAIYVEGNQFKNSTGKSSERDGLRTTERQRF